MSKRNSMENSQKFINWDCKITKGSYSRFLIILILTLCTSCQQTKASSNINLSPAKVPESAQKEMPPYVAEPGKENLKYGFIDHRGKFIVAPKFRIASCFKGGLASVITDKGHAYIDRLGHFITKPGEYITGHGSSCNDSWPNYNERLYSVEQNFRISNSKSNRQPGMQSYFGYVDSQGRLVIPLAPYLYAEDFSDGMARVTIATEATSDEIEAAKRRGAGPKPGTKVGYIDTTGKLVIPAKFDGAEGFRWGIAKVRVERYELDPDNPGQKKTVTTYGFIDKQGRYLVEPTTDLSDSAYGCKVSEQLIKNSQILMGKDALSKESPAIKQLCDSPDSAITRDGFVPLDLDLLPSSDVDQVLKNQAGKQLFPGKSSNSAPGAYYQRVDGGINEGLALIERDDGYKCFIDNQGKFVIPCKYKDATAFSEGVAAVAIEIDPKKK
jgi:hypothetical protein